MKFTDFLPPILTRSFVQTNLSQSATAPIRGVAAQEFGVSGTENFGGYIRREDYNPEFDDWQRAVAIYDKMRRSDAQVRHDASHQVAAPGRDMAVQPRQFRPGR